MSIAKDLEDALDKARQARACITENSRPEDKDMAREGYDACVAEELWPALERALEDLENRQLESVASFVLKKLKR